MEKLYETTDDNNNGPFKIVDKNSSIEHDFGNNGLDVSDEVVNILDAETKQRIADLETFETLLETTFVDEIDAKKLILLVDSRWISPKLGIEIVEIMNAKGLNAEKAFSEVKPGYELEDILNSAGYKE